MIDTYYKNYLIDAAPDILWYYVEAPGSYSGQVFGVGKYKNQVLLYEDYYGSCSYCGAWGEGGEPKDLAEILSKSTQVTTLVAAANYITNSWGDKYDKPNFEQIYKAVEDILNG